MTEQPLASAGRKRLILLAVAASVVAIVSARPFAGSWNDGSRLATTESLVDRGTLRIDDSIFVRPPERGSPYRSGDEVLQHGTMDRLLIGGNYYSDKSPVPALYMAAIYKLSLILGGPTAVDRPDVFCLLMTVATSGLAFMASVLSIFVLGRRLGLPGERPLVLAGVFGLGTVALPYTQSVNGHLMMLGTAAPLFAVLLSGLQRGWAVGRLLLAGSLLGISYTLDLGAGPILVLAISGFLLAEAGWGKTVLALTAAFPWFLLHHAVNYSIGGTFGPANAVPEYLNWPGSPFNTSNMTGSLTGRPLFRTIVYAFDLLFGKKGFIGHDLLLFLPLVYLPQLCRGRFPERTLVVAGLAWFIGTWLLYAATSTNWSGGCCSIRWFVPLLVPGFFAAAVVWRDVPAANRQAKVLGCGSLLMGAAMAWGGPWYMRMPPGYWVIYGLTVAVWIGQGRHGVKMPPIRGLKVRFGLKRTGPR